MVLNASAMISILLEGALVCLNSLQFLILPSGTVASFKEPRKLVA
jgi:hypothetical protein